MLSAFESFAISTIAFIAFILLVLLQATLYFGLFYFLSWLTFWTFGPEIFGYVFSYQIPLAVVFCIYILKFLRRVI